MTTKPQTPVEKSTATKQPKKRSFKSGLLTGAMILSLLQPTMSKTNAQLKAELTQALEQPTNSEMKITLSDAEAGGKKPKIVEAVKVAPLDTYDELKTFVLPPKDTIYFNELRAFQEKKNSLEQLKCKAIMYTMLQDTILKKLDPRQREIFALGRFETLIDMPGNNFKFSMKSEAIEGKVYIDK